MILLYRAIPLLSAIAIFIVFQIWNKYPAATFYIAGSLAVIVVGSIWALTSGRRSIWLFVSFLPSPFLFVAGSFAFFLIINDATLRQLYSIGIVLLYYFILRNIFSFLYQSESYQPYALENIYSYVNMVSLFLFYSALYGMRLFLSWPHWIGVVAALLLTMILAARTFWSYKISWHQSRLYIIIISIMAAQGYYAVGLLPTSFILNGFIVVIMYYVLINIAKDVLRDVFDQKNARRYIFTSAALIIMAIITARWY